MNLVSRIALALLVVLGLITVTSSIYQVREWEQVVITQFGRPVGGPVTEPGLHFRTPFVQHVNRFDKRILEWDGAANQITTADKRFIWVDTTARWRIEDPLLFLQTVVTEMGAQTRLDDVLDSATRDQIGAHALVEVVRISNRVVDLPEEDAGDYGGIPAAEENERIEVGRDGIIEKVVASSAPDLKPFGIKLEDLRIKRINYREDVQAAVYDRMKSERNRIAEQYRSEGQGRKAEIMGDRERDEKEIRSKAEREALEVMAKADAEAARIFAEAYNADPEFYAFWRSLEAYEKLVGENTTLVISPDSEIYRYLFSSK